VQRSRRIALLAHCLLNANARVEGIARYRGIHPVVRELDARGIAIIQLPCPEVTFAGLDRVRGTLEDYDTIEFRSHCRSHALAIAEDVHLYQDAGCEVGVALGVEGSPSCAVELTNLRGPEGKAERAPGTGVFMHELAAVLEPLGVCVTGLDAREDDRGVSTYCVVLDGLGWTRAANAEETG